MKSWFQRGQIICILLVTVFTSAGCAGIVKNARDEFMRRDLLDKHPEWSPSMVERVKNGQVTRGMTKEQVLACWGRPQRRTRAGGPKGIATESWEYPRHRLHFHEDTLNDWL